MRRLLIIILFSCLFSCNNTSEIKNSNNETLHQNVIKYIKSLMNDPESFELVSMKIDSVFYLKHQLNICSYLLEGYEYDLSTKGIEERKKEKEHKLSVAKYLNEENKKRYLKRLRTTEEIKKLYINILKDIDSLKFLMASNKDTIFRYNIKTIFRNKNNFNATVLDTLAISLTWDFKIE